MARRMHAVSQTRFHMYFCYNFAITLIMAACIAVKFWALVFQFKKGESLLLNHPLSRTRSSRSPGVFLSTPYATPIHHVPSHRHHLRFSFLINTSLNDFPGSFDLNLTSTHASTIEEADEYRRRAQELRTEARTMEIALEKGKLSKTSKKTADIQEWMSKLFVNNRPLTPEAVARILMEERFSEDHLVVLMEALYQRRKATSGDIIAYAKVKSKSGFPIADSSDTAPVVNITEFDLVHTYMQLLLDASEILDKGGSSVDNRRWSGLVSSQLRSRLNEWTRADEQAIRRRLEADIQARERAHMTATNYVRQTLGLNADTPPEVEAIGTRSSVERVLPVPMWIPASLLPYVLASKTGISAVDVQAIKERVLTKTCFFCTSSDSFPTAAVYRGNMRRRVSSAPMDAAEERTFSRSVFGEIQRAMDGEGISDRIQLFLLNDPDWRPTKDIRETRPKPILLALPKDVTPDESRIRRGLATRLVRKFANILVAVTALTYSVGCYALNPKIFDAIVYQHNLSALTVCVPMAVGLLAIQATHELAHRIIAKIHGMHIGLPVPLPCFSLGTFGCITPLRSFPPNRSALLDFALSGPLAGTLLSVLFMITGCYMTISASEAVLLSFPVVPVAVLKSSFLSGSILAFFLPKVIILPTSQPIPIHPLFLVGYSGILASALNLLPIFRLDGGRACTAAVGTRIGAIASAWTLLSMLSLALSGSGLAWTWGAFVLFFQRRSEAVVRDGVTAVHNARIGAWVLSLAIASLALLPFPGSSRFL